MTPATRSALNQCLRRLAREVPAGYVPMHVGDTRIGALPPAFARRVAAAGAPFLSGADGLRTDPRLSGEPLGAAWAAQIDVLRGEGWFRAWRNECYDVRLGEADDAAPVLCRLERGVFRRFGLRSRAVHLNAVTPDGRMWIARRADNKAIDPGCLDTLVGGGLASGETPELALLRECGEEAGIAHALASRAAFAGTLLARREEDEGMHDEWLHVWQLEAPADFVPHNTDGEVAGFMLLEKAEIAERILAGEFTEDAAAVTVVALLGNVLPY